ncbi:hypothetical protein Hanom_Chr10g00954071 [Helianthus anomalus]
MIHKIHSLLLVFSLCLISPYLGSTLITFSTSRPTQTRARLFQPAYFSSYRVMVCKFLASFEFAPRLTDQPEEHDDP